MKKLWGLLCAILAFVFSAQAELQNVEIGGDILIRYRHFINVFTPSNFRNANSRREIRIPNDFLIKRPIGPRGVTSLYRWDNSSHDKKFWETATTLHVKADFTQDVAAFIELYDMNEWGEDFRSDWITGADSRAVTRDDIEVNQAYIEVNDLWGMPVRVRVGRQAMRFGKGWLVTDRSTPTRLLSFDALRLTYSNDPFEVDLFGAKLAENGVVEEGGDVDFYGVYGVYKGYKPLQVSAYWYWLRDARSQNDTNFPWFVEWLEDVFGVDDYDVMNMHTIGLRFNGKSAGFDYDLEVAYQFGNADIYGAGFVPVGLLYGVDDAKFNNWAADARVGYTFSTTWSPRLFAFGCYYQGHDNRDISFWDWVNPFYKPDASISFNRLFSEINYMQAVNDTGGTVSNFAQAGIGVEVQPTEKVRMHLHVAKDWIVAPFDPPVTFRLGRFRVPIAPAFSFWTEEGSNDLGWEIMFWVRYNYTEDLYFQLSYNHLFVGKGLSRGAFIQWNGTDFAGGTDDDDAGYLQFVTGIKF